MDKQITIEELKNLVKDFTKERDWDKFLFPKTIATYLSLESAELLEKFVWSDNQESKDVLLKKQKEIEQELSDVLYWILQMSWIYNIDLSEALKSKIHQNSIKYPINKSKGNTNKYTEL